MLGSRGNSWAIWRQIVLLGDPTSTGVKPLTWRPSPRPISQVLPWDQIPTSNPQPLNVKTTGFARSAGFGMCVCVADVLSCNHNTIDNYNWQSSTSIIKIPADIFIYLDGSDKGKQCKVHGKSTCLINCSGQFDSVKSSSAYLECFLCVTCNLMDASWHNSWFNMHR